LEDPTDRVRVPAPAAWREPFKFLREHLPVEKGCSPHTCETYAFAFKLLFTYASGRLGIAPSKLCLEHLEPAMVLDFLAHLEQGRSNSPSTRNTRLAAIKAFMRYVEFHVPSALAHVKRHEQGLARHLTMDEIKAILNAPDPSVYLGIRDRAMLHVCFAAGLRVSELVGLPLANVSLQRTPSIHVLGKGRRHRSLPLWKETTADLRAWLAVRGDAQVPEVFVNAERTTMTRAGFEYVLDKHTRNAAEKCPSLKNRSVSPHQLRHSCAVMMLQATHDIRKVALWLGHADVRTTEV
jgi:integrase/recombinase XerD